MDRDDAPGQDDKNADTEAHARREFIKKIGQASAMAPAVSLLMAAQTKSAKAQSAYGGGSGSGSGSS